MLVLAKAVFWQEEQRGPVSEAGMTEEGHCSWSVVNEGRGGRK